MSPSPAVRPMVPPHAAIPVGTNPKSPSKPASPWDDAGSVSDSPVEISVTPSPRPLAARLADRMESVRREHGQPPPGGRPDRNQHHIAAMHERQRAQRLAAGGTPASSSAQPSPTPDGVLQPTATPFAFSSPARARNILPNLKRDQPPVAAPNGDPPTPQHTLEPNPRADGCGSVASTPSRPSSSGQILGKRPPMHPSTPQSAQRIKMQPLLARPSFGVSDGTPTASPTPASSVQAGGSTMPAPSKKVIISEVIDVDDDDTMTELMSRPRSNPAAITSSPVIVSETKREPGASSTPGRIPGIGAPFPSNGRPGSSTMQVGDDQFVDSGGNAYAIDKKTGKITIFDSPPHLNAQTTLGAANTMPLAGGQPAFMAPPAPVFPMHAGSFKPASSAVSPGEIQAVSPVSPPIYGNNDLEGNEFCNKSKLEDLVKANAMTADATEEADTPEELNITLMPHQRRALHWMARRENPSIVTSKKQKAKNEEEEEYEEEDEVEAVDPECRGGILADEQGLGKTLSLISLLLVNRPPPTARDAEPPWRTLIVCPLSLVSQWKDEIEGRIRDNDCPSIHVYHGQKRSKSAEDLMQYDIVLTTFATLGKEYPKINKEDPRYKACKENKLPLPRHKAGPAFKVQWRRVVLDEAHNVKNRRTNNFQAMSMLKSEYRWCLTGTPIQNTVDDIYALFEFIRYKFVPNYEIWNLNWKKRLENNNARVRERAFKCFQAIVGVVCLRRTKHDNIDGKPLIVLPERKAELLENLFDDEDEQKFYQSVAEKSVIAVNKYLVAGTLAHNYSSVLLLLLRMRQACCHPFLIEYAGMLNKSRRDPNDHSVEGFVTPYSSEDLLEATELVTSGHSLLRMLDEGSREGVRKRLEPTEVNQSQFFMCAKCHQNGDYRAGSALPCAHFLCETCAGQSAAQGQCRVCHQEIATDVSEALINLNDLRMEVHAIVRAGLIEDENAFDLPTSTSLRAILKTRGAAPLKMQKRKLTQSRVSDFFVSKDADSDSDNDALDAFIAAANEDGLVDSEMGTPAKPRNRQPMQSKYEDIGDSESSDESDGSDFVPVVRVKDEPATLDDAAILVPDSDDDSIEGNPIEEEDELEIASFYNKGKKKAKPEPAMNGGANGIGNPTNVKREAVPMADVSNLIHSNNNSNLNNGAGAAKKEHTPAEILPGGLENTPADVKEEQLSVTEKLIRAVSQPSTKIKLLLKQLAITKERDPAEKTLVFSQWTTMLDIVEYHIEGAGYETCRLDGSMAMAARKDQIREFSTNPRKTVFLISLHAGGTGLNLTAASNVILCDVWWNPQTEEQAIDRVHRIGQKRPVQIFRFKMTNTVEDRIYDICARKKELSDGMLGVAGAQTMGRKKLTIQEVMYMFGGAAQALNNPDANPEALQAAQNILQFNQEGGAA